MIGVSQNDLGPDILFQFPLVNRFHGTGGAYGHKYRCFNDSVMSLKCSRPGLGYGIGMVQSKIHAKAKIRSPRQILFFIFGGGNGITKSTWFTVSAAACPDVRAAFVVSIHLQKVVF